MINVVLFNLQRHSDHHAYAGKDYLHLENVRQAPQWPMGYGPMMVLALIPVLWRKVMDPRVRALSQSTAAP